MTTNPRYAGRALCPALLAAALASATAGCGSEAVNECEGAAADPRCQVDMLSPQGGEVRVEQIIFTDGTRNLSLISFLLADMTPQRFDMPATRGCTSYLDGPRWPLGQGEPRRYLDAGTLTLAGGPQPLELRAGASRDGLGRLHDLVYTHWGFAPVNVAPGTTHTISLSGSDELPATTWAGDQGAFVPHDFGDDMTPTTRAPIAIPAGQPFTTTYTPGPTGGVDGFFVGFLDGQGVMTHFCQADYDGALTVPAEIIDEIPPRGSVIRGAYSHRLNALRAEDDPALRRRVDVLGTNCFMTPYERP